MRHRTTQGTPSLFAALGWWDWIQVGTLAAGASFLVFSACVLVLICLTSAGRPG